MMTGKTYKFVIFIAALFLRACVSILYMCVNSGVHVCTLYRTLYSSHMYTQRLRVELTKK